MLRLLSWSSGLAADKITPQEVHCLAPQRHKSPTIDRPKPSMLKRKRVDSADFNMSQSPAKRRIDKMPQSLASITSTVAETPPLLASSSVINGAPSTSVHQPQNSGQVKMENSTPISDKRETVQTRPDKDTLRQTINSQISLEILLKHNELRLIDQEIAKCQIALEQLRRCSEIAYPSTRLSEAVSQGQGPAVRSRYAVQPESPAPWGVTDGPYTRHYAKWLLPDPSFDGGELPSRAGGKIPAGKTPTKGRTTRGSFAESSTAAGKSRAQRAGKFQALSNGYPQPKDKAGPMIQKRKSDSLLVKLVCLDCRRDNFSSAQGFINHCRIAHGRNFASHDAAADACGEPVDVDEAGAVVGGDGVASASTAGLVHPLIYSAHMLKQETPRKLSDQGSTNENSIVRVSPTNSFRDRTSGHGSNSHVTPSPLTPNLSTLMQRRGANLDLQCLVADMKTPVPLDESSESEGEENDEASVPEAPALGRHPHLTGAMQPVRSTVASTSSIPPAGRKGLNSPPLVQTVSNQSSMTSAQASPPDLVPNPYISATHSNGLEPSPTNESNQAPSLVDDDGDEEYEAHSPSYSGSEGADVEGRDLDFDVEDGDESGPSTRNRSTESEYAGTPKQHPSPTPTRRASALRRSHIGREEKHVSFVSPSPAREPEPEPEQSQKSGDRKRRRTTTGSS